MAGEKQKFQVTGNTLKVIALVTMFIDHTGAAVLYRYLACGFVDYDSSAFSVWYVIYMIMRGIGRLAFPVYCFLLVEGFTYTSSRLKYAIRLFVFSLISEVPFDLAFNYTVFDWTSNNVFWTLLIGLLVIWGMEALLDKKDELQNLPARIGLIIGSAALAIAGMAVAEGLLHTDYGAVGVACIVALYLLRDNRLLGFIVAVGLLTVLADTSEVCAIVMLVPIYFYNGQRGKNSPLLKYLFYVFYPAHLLLLVLIVWLTGMPVIL